MANITITVQSLLNTAVYNSYTIDNGQTVAQLKTAIDSAQSFDSTWYDLVAGNVLTESSTLSSLGITTGTQLRTHNKIARLATKEARQIAKLDLAALDRVASGQSRTIYDITELPNPYNGNIPGADENANTGGLVEGRPWVAMTSGSLLIPDTSSRITMTPGLAVGATTTTPFTVEGWFYSTVNPGTDSGPVLLSTTTGSGTPAYYKALTVNVNSSTQVVVDSNGAAATAFDFAQTMLVNTWYYLAVSRDTSGYIQVWMAKKGDATAAASTTGRFDSAGAGAAWTLTGLSDCIGSFVPANRFTTGYISNLRVTNTNLYTTTDATIAVPTAPFTEVTGTVLLVNDNTLTDQTSNQTLAAVGTAAGNVLNPF